MLSIQNFIYISCMFGGTKVVPEVEGICTEVQSKAFFFQTILVRVLSSEPTLCHLNMNR